MISPALSEAPVIDQESISVQFGCGLCTPDGWVNFDASPALILQHLPIIGKVIPSGPFGRFPENSRYGDILKGLPVTNESIDLLYCSHVLEHLTVEEARVALRNCYRHLKPGGIFRMVLPDLKIMAREYVESTSPDAVHEFMRLTWLGEELARPSIISTLKQWMSRGRHLWMWDYEALSQELVAVGFNNIRKATFSDSGISAFDAVEDSERWSCALGIQCTRE